MFFVTDYLKKFWTSGNDYSVLDWIYQFLLNNKDKLQPNNPDSEDNYNLCFAEYLFAIGEYEQVLNLLNGVIVQRITHKLQERRLRLKTYIKLDMRFQVEDGVNSARKFLSLNKSKLTPQYLLRQRNFFNTIHNMPQEFTPLF